MKTALVIGASGLTGQSLVKLLLNDERFERVVTFVRRPGLTKHSKLEEHIVDFDKPATWQPYLTGDILFSTLGTTIKVAGTKAAQYKVDHDYPLAFAQAALDNGVKSYALVSAHGANAKSHFFYMRMKGELDEKIMTLSFDKIIIARPGLIAGKRKENRVKEALGLHLLTVLNSVGLLKAYRPTEATAIAQSLINAYFDSNKGLQILTPDKLRAMA